MYLIVGLDPGKTIGVVCLNLEGNLVFKSHNTFAGTDWIANAINNIGTPVIVASDKPEAGTMVKKINAVFNSTMFEPQKDFKISEKRAAAKSLGIKNPHERDAYVAAISAYHSYANKFKQIEHITKGKDVKEIEEVKAKVVKKYSINEALENKKANRK